MTAGTDLVAEAAERLFADLATPAVARAAEEKGVWPATLWQAVEEAGFAAALEPNSGVTLAEALAVLRAAGRHPAPIPLAETMMARELAARSGLALPDGPLSLGVGAGLDSPRLEGQNLIGRLPRVAFARQAKAVVVLVHTGEREVVVCVPVDRTRLSQGRNLAGEPRDDIHFEQVVLNPDVFRQAPDGIDEPWLLRRGALLRCAQIVGALEAVLAMSVAYANERTQFGRPIGKFQAIQHQLAGLGGEVAASIAMLDVATALAAAGTAGGDLAIAAAKARASEAAGSAAAIAHRVHGAIGFTREFALQTLTRRLLSWRDEFGGEAEWHKVLGRAVLAANTGPLWPHLSTL